MQPIALRTAAIALIAIVATACGAAGPPASPSTAPSAAPPATYADYETAMCASFTSLIRAVGNPDAGTPSVMSKGLDDAVTAGDALGAERAAAAMLSELETGRQHAAAAARWQPAVPAMVQMDKLLVAFEALTTAKRAVAARVAGAVDPQKAFEQAGGVEAWTGVLTGIREVVPPTGASPQACRAFSGQI